MKALVVLLPLALATGVFGQAVHRGFGSVVFPGGTSGTTSGITRNFGSAVFPGGIQTPSVNAGTPVIGARPGSIAAPTNSNFRRFPTTRSYIRSTPYIYAYPMFVGGGSYDNSYAPQESAPPQQQPNITVIYPPQQQAAPTMIQAGPDGEYTNRTLRRRQAVEDDAEPSTDAPHYLLAFKDHTIYSAVAYWADGDTLHYFTSGNTHNQASLSLIDRALTERLNRELGIDFKLPAEK